VATDDQSGRWTASSAGIDGRLLDATRFSLDNLRPRFRQIVSDRLDYTLDDNDASTAWIDPNPATAPNCNSNFPPNSLPS
jgi:hypothetical protein